MNTQKSEMIRGLLVRGLTQLDWILQKAETWSIEQGKDGVAQLRLIEDMLPLSSQVQFASDNAKGVTARMAGDDEKINSVTASFPWHSGKFLAGNEYIFGMALPNFFFHVTTAYAILRANGVLLGKADFIGKLDWQNL